MGWLLEILARRAISWALVVCEARRRILEVLMMVVARPAMMTDADLILWDFERTLGTELIEAGGHRGIRLVPALG